MKVNVSVTSAGNKSNAVVQYPQTYYDNMAKLWAISSEIINGEDYSAKHYAEESKKQIEIATEKANFAAEQATIATNKVNEVIDSGNEALSNISAQEITSKNAVNAEGNTQVASVQSEGLIQINNVKNQGLTSINSVKTTGTAQIDMVKKEGTNQINLTKAQVEIATEQAEISTNKANEAKKSAETAAASEINAKTSENNTLVYKNSAINSAQTATEKAKIAESQAVLATEQAKNAYTSAANAKEYANSASNSAENAKQSQVACESILNKLGTAIKIKGRVNSLNNLPMSGNLDGDAYLVGEDGLDAYPEYYWYLNHWEFLGTSGGGGTWGTITGDISAQEDLATALNNKQNTIVDLATIRTGAAKGATAVQPTSLAKVATTGSYNDLSNKPTIPTVNNGMLTIQKNGVNVKTFTANQSASVTANIVVPTKISELTNDSNYITSSASITGNAATATKATQDASGRVFTTTYATKTEAKYTAGTGITITNNVISTSKPANIHFVTETYINGTSWYRLYDDNWCEQGGYAADNSSVIFLKPYTNNSYTLIGSGVTGSVNGPQFRQIMPNSKSATGFSSTVAGGVGVWWQASGYIK